MSKNKIKHTTGEKVFTVINTTLIILACFTCLFPFIHELAISFSSGAAVMSGKVSLFPIEFQTEAYKKVFENASMWHSLVFTIVLTVVFTVIALAMTILCAYPLSRKRLYGGKWILLLITVTMYFRAGTIPAYMLIYNLGLIDKVWVLILPFVINTFNMIMMRTSFMSIPTELEEAAMIDGCNDYQVLWHVILPVSKPILATIALFYAVQRWNSFADALYYINDPKLYPLQLKLQQIIQQGQADDMMSDINSQLDVVVPKAVQAASIIFATVPILLVYPKLQKYFVKGAMIGAVKG